MINQKRPQGYKAKPPVDLTRRTLKPGRRQPFIDPEDLTLATLAGPQGLKNVIMDVHKEIMALRREMQQVCGKHVHKMSQHTVSTQDCTVSPFGLCCFKLVDPRDFRTCIFCNQLHNN